jgi:hypothetical protein
VCRARHRLDRESRLANPPLARGISGFFAISNIAESELLRQNSIFWVLFVATVIAVRTNRTSGTVGVR